jgi:hypothetical protein
MLMHFYFIDSMYINSICVLWLKLCVLSTKFSKLNKIVSEWELWDNEISGTFDLFIEVVGIEMHVRKGPCKKLFC